MRRLAQVMTCGWVLWCVLVTPAAQAQDEDAPAALPPLVEGEASPTVDAPDKGPSRDAPLVVDTPDGEPLMNSTGGNDTAAASVEASMAYPSLEDAEITHTVMWSGRMIAIPDFILDSFFDEHASHWQGRGNFAYGVEYNVRFVGTLDLSFGVYYSDLSMPSQYWVEKDGDPSTAEYTRQNLKTVSVEANVYGYYDFIPELSLIYGGGLWGGALIGTLDKANIRSECGEAVAEGNGSLEACPFEPVFIREDGLPPIIGFVNVAVGLRATLAERFVIKAEAGFRGFFFGGLGIGAQFF